MKLTIVIFTSLMVMGCSTTHVLSPDSKATGNVATIKGEFETILSEPGSFSRGNIKSVMITRIGTQKFNTSLFDLLAISVELEPLIYNIDVECTYTHRRFRHRRRGNLRKTVYLVQYQFEIEVKPKTTYLLKCDQDAQGIQIWVEDAKTGNNAPINKISVLKEMPRLAK